VKGLYADARAGKIKGFTGIDDPYEAPSSPEVTLQTGRDDVTKSLEELLGYLEREGLVAPGAGVR
jgi:adenylylsulfate kinase-like enzyme